MMKRIFLSMLLVLISFTLISCGNDTNSTFIAIVLENNGSLLVEPVEGSAELRSADKIIIHTSDTKILNYANKEIDITAITVNQRVEVSYNGMIMESYPAQIMAFKIKLLE